MRRDYFTVDVQTDPDDDGHPTVSITYDGPDGLLEERLNTETGTLDASTIDVTFRRQPDSDSGVLSLTNRFTGEYVLETKATFEEISSLVTAAKDRADEDGQYQVRLTGSDGKSLVYEKHTLLVYDHDGGLLRQQSLIPGGVEL